MLKKLVTSAIGLAAVLTYWTITGHHTAVNSGPQQLPAKFLNGGGGMLTIEANSTAPATLRYTLRVPSENGDPNDTVNGYDQLDAGPHSWTIEIAPGTGVELEWEARNPQPGARLSWAVKLNGKELDAQEEVMNGPLQANEAFFIQFEREDVTRTAAGE